MVSLAHPAAEVAPATATPTRALIVMPLATQRGGAELSLLQLLEHRRLAMLEPTVAFLEPGTMVDWCRQHGIDVVTLEAGRLRQVRRLGASVRSLTRLAGEARAQIVVSWMAKAHIYGALTASAAGLPSVWFQPGYPGGLAPLDRIATLLPADRVIVVSRGVQRGQERLLPRRPTTVVYPAVDIDRFSPARIGGVRQVRRRLGLREDSLVFGSVGRLDSWKGFDVMLAAVPTVIAKHPEATFVLVGGEHEFNREYAEQLRGQARALGLGERVRMVGFQENPEEWMQAMDVFVHASENEPFGMVVIEAMALGKGVIASAEGGPTEVITPGVDGILSPYGDPDALAAAVNRLLGDPALRGRMGQAAAERAADFSVARYASELGAVIAVAAGATRPVAAT